MFLRIQGDPVADSVCAQRLCQTTIQLAKQELLPTCVDRDRFTSTAVVALFVDQRKQLRLVFGAIVRRAVDDAEGTLHAPVSRQRLEQA